jgi:signal transduction histidine kinase/ActR/RegA family two-component response regulator
MSAVAPAAPAPAGPAPARGRLGPRLILATLCLLGLGSAVAGYLQITSAQEALDRQMDELGQAIARSAAGYCVEVMIGVDPEYLAVQDYVDRVVNNDELAFMEVTSNRGQVVAAHPHEAAQRRAVRAGCRLYQEPVRVARGDPTLAAIGTVTVGLSTAPQANLVAARTREAATVFILTFVAVALVVTILLRRMLHDPLSQLDRQAQRLARGQLDVPLAVAGGAELGRLAATLDEMRVNLKASHESIAQQNERLLELDRMKAQFLANLSHEVRTPLTALLGFADLLADAELPGEAHAQVLTICRNARHLHSLLNEVLDLTKLGSGELLVEPAPFDPQALVADLVEFVRPRAEAKGLALGLAVRKPVPRSFVSDATRVRQVLLHLATNALKFTESGSVTVELAQQDRAGCDRWLVFRVRDTGPGVPAGLRARLFEPWTQGDTALSRRTQGLGIGLSISRAIAARLGGELRCDSELGQGSTFVLALPWRVPAPPAGATAAAEPPGRAGRVLLADDALDNQKLISAMLRKAGYDVTVVGNGRLACEALERARDGGAPFDLVLMDVQMPELDGLEATAWLRAHGFTQPIVAVTAHAMESDRQRCLQVGCNEYVTKPVQREALVMLLERLRSPRPDAG